MSVALYVVVSTGLVVLLSARLREAREELARVRRECDGRAEGVRDECAAYAQGVAVSLLCLLAALGAAQWYARPPGRPASSGQPGADAPAGPAGRETAR